MKKLVQRPRVGVGVMILKKGKVLLDIHIGLLADWKAGVLKNLEPEKTEIWSWYDLNNLPEPIFEMSRLAIESYKTGKTYFDVLDTQ